MNRSKPPNEGGSGTRNHDIIVIGGSAGAIEVLVCLVKALPPDLRAAVFIATHMSPDSPSLLPEILNRSALLSAAAAIEGEPVAPGRIYVASPDRHMLLGNGMIRLTRGPRENGHRPAIDPLFRTAAACYGARVIGVILSGNLDDGSAGLLQIKKHGGITVVQDPSEARYPNMPTNADIAIGGADHVIGMNELGSLLTRLVSEPAPAAESAHEDLASREIELAGELGAGHAFAPEALLAAQAEDVEEALWSALRALSESSAHARVRAQDERARATNEQ